MKVQEEKKAFTLVELIIVITILAILATIAFVSFQGYSSQSRDSNRVATVKNIENGVNIFITKTGKVPEPDDVIGSGRLTSGGPVLNIVGKVGAGISRSINLNETPLDPRAQEQYWYGVDTLRRYFQVGLTLESETAFAPGILPSYAGNILEAKVQGNYEYPLKLENIVYSLPSLLFLGSGGVLSNQTEFVVDEGNNVPYNFGQAKSGTQSVAEVLKIITGTGNLSLTGVSLPTMTMSDYKASTGSEIPSAFSGVAQLLGITDKNKLGVVVYGKDFVGVGVSGGRGLGVQNLDNGPTLLPGPFTNIDGSITPYIPDGANGSGRFTCVSGTCSNQNTNSGVVLDNVTGLYWQSGYSQSVLNWADAKTYCEGLNIGSQIQWRLPDITETISIIDYHVINQSINTTYFSAKSDYYWTSTSVGTTNARIVNFTYGTTGNNPKSSIFNVRCVGGNKSSILPWQGTPVGHFDNLHNVGISYQAESRLTCYSGICNNVSGSNGVVFDSVTNLYWQSGYSDSPKQWESAKSYCNQQSFGGLTGWRVPTIKEISSIIDYTRTSPSLDNSLFASYAVFWSGTEINLYDALYIAVDYFSIYYQSKLTSVYVKCVR